MSGATLHYIFDPLCGWCYGAAPLLKAAQNIAGLTISLHAGGMMTGPNRRQINREWRNYVMPHDKRIEELTGQPFGEDYFNGLLRDTSAIVDSAPPITAILVAETLTGRGLDMLHRIQHAHYFEGQRISDTPILVELAGNIGLDKDTFSQTLQRMQGVATAQHIAESRALLEKLQSKGFPTFALQNETGEVEIIPAGKYLGDQAAWIKILNSAIS
ncbi:protein-disulfide isomerase [Yersinia ruckeri]|uniref:DsbA family protein n=1 Tax=Yersinia ruckeri TaxID=29486 RepID=UPI0004E33C4A|nr:DsbA family protein [Yersinia ruckeri]ARY99999.1 DSBA-like thioredoxin domain protein [Yersinia ruckeri]EKN4695733.1 DsbA family protein [Yersinia ruckeri]KFE40460.1 protein-disulfide isomerase [Yersinia ruckeri]OIX31371.1 protein-disulfide isomerase [Yersinia ruckeri]OIX31804.1 protein-disulfide isomerase [Yersinia ruckeri]